MLNRATCRLVVRQRSTLWIRGSWSRRPPAKRAFFSKVGLFRSCAPDRPNLEKRRVKAGPTQISKQISRNLLLGQRHCRHCGGRLVLPDADRRSAVRTACPSTSRRGELSPHQISRAPLQCPDPFRRPAQQTKLWSVPHACCPRAMHPCIQPPRASRPRAAPCDPSTLVSTCSAARCSRPVCARRRVFRVTSWGARDGLGRFRDVRLTLDMLCAAQVSQGPSCERAPISEVFLPLSLCCWPAVVRAAESRVLP